MSETGPNILEVFEKRTPGCHQIIYLLTTFCSTASTSNCLIFDFTFIHVKDTNELWFKHVSNGMIFAMYKKLTKLLLIA